MHLTESRIPTLHLLLLKIKDLSETALQPDKEYKTKRCGIVNFPMNEILTILKSQVMEHQAAAKSAFSTLNANANTTDHDDVLFPNFTSDHQRQIKSYGLARNR